MRFLRGCIFFLAFGVPVAGRAATPGVEQIVSRAERQVLRFLDTFSNVRCTEKVDQEKLGKNNKVEYEERSAFDYMVIADTSGGDLTLEESRRKEGGKPQSGNRPLLVTNGFATLLLIFHPQYQSGFEFSFAGEDVWFGRPVTKLAFRHVRGMRTPTVLLLRGREYPLELMGTVWIDNPTGTVERMEAELQSDMQDIGLRKLHTEVTYAPVRFHGLAEESWLPSEATVEVETARQHWRNLHRFTEYQRFSVDTQHRDNVPVAQKGGGAQ